MAFLDQLRRERAAREQQQREDARHEEEQRKARSAAEKQEVTNQKRLHRQRWTDYRNARRFWTRSRCGDYFDEVVKRILADLTVLPQDKRSQVRGGGFLLTPPELNRSFRNFAYNFTYLDNTQIQTTVLWQIVTGSRIQHGPSPNMTDYREQYVREALIELGLRRTIRAVMSAHGTLTIIAATTHTVSRQEWRNHKSIIDRVFESAFANPREEAYEARISATYDDPPDTSSASDSYVFG